MKKWIPAALLVLVLGGCAKAVSTSTGKQAQEYLKLWIDEFHPGIQPNADGLYILEDIPGSGLEWNSEKPYTRACVTIRQLNGTISATTEERLAKQLGIYSRKTFYGAKYIHTGVDNSYAGVDAVLKGMRVGGTRTAVVPAWMLTTSRYDSQDSYIENCTSSTHFIYTFSLEGQCVDIDDEEKHQVSTYVSERYPKEKSSSYTDKDPDGTFYFVSDSSAFIGTHMHPMDTTMRLNYTGMRLSDGQVFDTTIEKVARDAGIYSADITYGPVSVTYASTYSSISMGSSGSSLISGFQGGLFLMKYDGQKATVIFTSGHGYSTSGSGDVIPAWTPLRFDLELVKD